MGLDLAPRRVEDRTYTQIESQVEGVTSFRVMTQEECDRYEKATAKDRVKVQPVSVEGVP